MKRLFSRSGCVSALLLASGLILAPSSGMAAEIIVAGPQGLVYSGDSDFGPMTFFGVCGGPVSSMALTGGELFLGSSIGRVYRIDMRTRHVVGWFAVSSNAAAMTAHDGTLLIGGSNQNVIRVNPQTGAVLATYPAPEPVVAMTIYGDTLYIAGSSSAIYRADANIGEFSYFTCSCFGPVNGLTADADNLFLVDASIGVWKIDRETGTPLTAFSVQPTAGAVAASNGSAIVGHNAGGVTTFDMQTGESSDTLAAPLDIRAMLVIPACTADLNDDRIVNLTDLSRLLAAFGTSGGGDITGDGMTDLSDLSEMLASFGTSCD